MYCSYVLGLDLQYVKRTIGARVELLEFSYRVALVEINILSDCIHL